MTCEDNVEDHLPKFDILYLKITQSIGPYVDFQSQKIERAMLQDLLSKQVESQKSKSLAVTARIQSNERKIAGQRHVVYDILASAAAFKAKVQAGDSLNDPQSCHGEKFKYLDKWIFNDGEATMSTFSKSRKVCFIVCISKTDVVENADNVGMEILPR